MQEARASVCLFIKENKSVMEVSSSFNNALWEPPPVYYPCTKHQLLISCIYLYVVIVPKHPFMFGCGCHVDEGFLSLPLL